MFWTERRRLLFRWFVAPRNITSDGSEGKFSPANWQTGTKIYRVICAYSRWDDSESGWVPAEHQQNCIFATPISPQSSSQCVLEVEARTSNRWIDSNVGETKDRKEKYPQCDVIWFALAPLEFVGCKWLCIYISSRTTQSSCISSRQPTLHLLPSPLAM